MKTAITLAILFKRMMKQLSELLTSLKWKSSYSRKHSKALLNNKNTKMGRRMLTKKRSYVWKVEESYRLTDN